jgi:hypothetical protein
MSLPTARVKAIVENKAYVWSYPELSHLLGYELGLKGALAPVRAARTSQGTRRGLVPVHKTPLAPV